MPDVDIAILGGGCAGLSLAARLATQPSPGFAVIEPRSAYADDRTWSFWRTARDPFEDCVRASWSGWSVSGPGGTVTRRSVATPYQTVAGGAFYDRARSLIGDARHGDLVLGASAGHVAAKPKGFRIETDRGTLTARRVVDARPPARRPAYGQFFLGREIVTGHAPFDPRIVPLMHFRRGYSTGVDFLYVLPFARDRALVEVTSFAPTPPSRAVLERWLEEEIDALGAAGGAVVRDEAGALPMEAGFRDPASPGITRIGLGGGAARPSTGYAFARIQAQADRLARALMTSEPARLPQDPPMTRFMDRVFLKVLAAAPDRGPALFESLFRRVPQDRLERFLSGSTRTADRLSVMTSLPPLPFLRAAALPA